MNDYKMACIIDNFINGNLTDFKNAIKRMSKKDLLNMVFIMQADGLDVLKVLNYLD